jgi:hypothetical protein
MASIFDRFKSLFSSAKNNQTISGIILPNNLAEKVTPYGLKTVESLYDLSVFYYTHSAIWRLIVDRIVSEVFRNGFFVKPVDGNNLTSEQLEKISEDLLHINVNMHGQKLTDVLSSALLDLLIFGNGFILVNKTDDSFNIFKIPPNFVEINISNGKLAYDESGSFLAFCKNHRNRLVKIPQQQIEFSTDEELQNLMTCLECGEPLYPAVYTVKPISTIMSSNMNNEMYYTFNEIVHIKKWSTSGYFGIPPILALFNYLNILLAHESWIANTYNLQRSPNAIVVIRGHERNLVATIQNAIKNAFDTGGIPFIALDSKFPAEKFIDVIDLSATLKETDMTKLRDEMISKISAFYGVAPIFNNDLRGVGGLNAEGLQVVITNRSLAGYQQIINNALKQICEVLQLPYTIQLRDVEIMDMIRVVEYNQKILQVIQQLVAFGYQIKTYTDQFGRIQYEIVNQDLIINQNAETKSMARFGGLGGIGGIGGFGEIGEIGEIGGLGGLGELPPTSGEPQSTVELGGQPANTVGSEPT